MPNEPGGAQPAPSTPPQTAAPSSETFDFAKWQGDDPNAGKIKEAIEREFYDRYNAALSEKYGDVLPLISEANDNTELRAALAEIAKDPELRSFVTGPALQAYHTTRAPAAAAQPGTPAPADKQEIDKLRNELTEFRSKSELDAYRSRRQQEFAALQNEFEDLRFTKADDSDKAYRKAKFVLGYAEKYSTPERPMSYRQVYDEMQQIYRQTPPPPAPATTSAAARSAQAPRSATEARDREAAKMEGRDQAIALLKKSGGLRGLADATRRR